MSSELTWWQAPKESLQNYKTSNISSGGSPLWISGWNRKSRELLADCFFRNQYMLIEWLQSKCWTCKILIKAFEIYSIENKKEELKKCIGREHLFIRACSTPPSFAGKYKISVTNVHQKIMSNLLVTHHILYYVCVCDSKITTKAHEKCCNSCFRCIHVQLMPHGTIWMLSFTVIFVIFTGHFLIIRLTTSLLW